MPINKEFVKAVDLISIGETKAGRLPYEDSAEMERLGSTGARPDPSTDARLLASKDEQALAEARACAKTNPNRYR